MEIHNRNNILIRIRNLLLSFTMTAHNFNVTNRLKARLQWRFVIVTLKVE